MFASHRHIFSVIAMFFCVAYGASAKADVTDTEQPQEKSDGRVLVIPLSDEGRYMVDQVQADFIIESLDQAEENGYRAVILKIDTFGGVVFSAREITERLLRMKLPTYAYVETKAISAGAFIAFACNRIFMESHTTIGDAQMIYQTPEGGIEEAPEKLVTVFRSDWKKACDANGYPFPIAVGFFDVDAEVLQLESAVDEGGHAEPVYMLRDDYNLLEEAARPKIKKIISKKGELLTLHAKEAEALGFATEVASFEQFLSVINYRSDQLESSEMDWRMDVLRYLGANPLIYFVLVLIGLNGIYTEIKAPGFGIAGLTALVCFSVVFGTRYILGTASNIEIMFFIVGIGLALVEIFVLPGFGVAGISGIVLILGSLVMASLPEFDAIPATELRWDWLQSLVVLTLGSFALSFLTFAFLFPVILKTSLMKRVIAVGDMTADQGYVYNTVEDPLIAVGLSGVAVGPLRPTGKMKAESGKHYDVVSEGGFIDAHTRVEVIQVDGNRIVVRPIDQES